MAGAKAYEAVLRQKLSRGESVESHAPEASQSLAAFARQRYVPHLETNCKPSTQRSALTILEQHLIPHFGKQPINSMTTESIESFKAIKLKSGLSPKTINNILAVLRKCIQMATDDIPSVKMPKFKWLKVPPNNALFLRKDECLKLLERIAYQHGQPILLCALRTGMRMGELIGLRWQDIDLAGGVLTVRRSIVRGIEGSPKSNKIRHIPISEDLLTSLKALEPRTGFVFAQAETGEPMTRGALDRMLRTACKRAGLKPIGWHVLRHTFASQLVTAGASLRVVQELLGHSDPKMTLRYAHLAPSALREAVALLVPQANLGEGSGQPVGKETKKVSVPEIESRRVLQTLFANTKEKHLTS